MTRLKFSDLLSEKKFECCLDYVKTLCIFSVFFIITRASPYKSRTESFTDRSLSNGPRCEKTGLRGFRPGPT